MPKRPTLKLPEVPKGPRRIGLNLNLKESIMDKQHELDLELEVVDLGDAKALTQGVPALVFAEDNPLIQGRPEA